MIDNTDNLWLRQWLFYSLKLQIQQQGLWREQLKLLSQSQPSTVWIIGVSGSQGSGKSTLCAALQKLWSGFGVQSDVISLDDYYLEPELRAERAALWHPLFAERGVPGTHDTELLLSQLQAFRRGEAQNWRRYDKGRDCAEPSPEQTQARILLLEGWCVGLHAQIESDLLQDLNPLEQQQDPQGIWRQKVNQQLAADYQHIWQQLDLLTWLRAPDWEAVCRWRQWQEKSLQQKQLGKSPAELEQFMLYFERLTRESWRQLPERADFILSLDQEHQFVGVTPDA